ncbi:hypothetical protein GBK04_08440 [Cytophagaceae bacterium SJW1-29]|uniref:DDE Tnp4 domain-containing protein n=2 Tax=Salmonirosea aquatica TaxID=2654236 RepID=A0A7C9FC79_9BACT|nr:hypothetical protein [Cytophagaceae bacterium SJW1-29]
MIMATTDRYIHFLSKCWVGKSHDYTQLKVEFPAGEPWFKDLRVRVDLGYQGIVKDYECEQISIPEKKPRKGKLTEVQKESNRGKSSERVYVEQAIGGMKRFRYLSDRLRTRKVLLYESAIGICAGLWNFYLTN